VVNHVKQSKFCSENQVKAIINSVNEMSCYLTLKQVVHTAATVLYCKRNERKAHMLSMLYMHGKFKFHMFKKFISVVIVQAEITPCHCV
jgi:hypothetical protein